MANELMSDRRPACVVDECNQQFEDVKSESWAFLGDEPFYYWEGEPQGIGTAELLKNTGQTVIDIGCGKGMVLKDYAERCMREGLPVKLLGISAVDYSNGDNPLIKVADVHNLTHIAGDKKWDRVISKYTFMHLADPLSVYEQALNCVKLGGTVTTDGFLWDEYGDYWDQRSSSELANTVVDYLCTSGYFKILSRFDRRAHPRMPEVRQGIPSLHVRRLAPETQEIHLPVGYETDGAKWGYVISNPALRSLHRTSTAFAKAVDARKV